MDRLIDSFAWGAPRKMHREGSDRGDDRFGVVIREGTRPLRQRPFCLMGILPKIRLPYDGAAEWGVHRRRQSACFGGQ